MNLGQLILKIKNNVLSWGYQYILKPFFFRRDPEVVHDRMVRIGARLGQSSFLRSLTRAAFDYTDRHLQQTILGLSFPNPVGLAAGFDKNAELLAILPAVGFGFIEVGSITGYPCVGNPKPRLWRLPSSKGLVVNYGLKSDGVDVLRARLADRQFAIPVGTSVAPTNCSENIDLERSIQDQVKTFEALATIGAYFTINISCPNATGGQPFIDPVKLDKLLDALDQVPTTKPIFLKLSPDMSYPQVDLLLEVILRHRVHGLIAANLTKPRENSHLVDRTIPPVGGISGLPVQELSDCLLAYLYRRLGSRLILVGCGGIFRAEDAYRKIRLGASLVQLATGMIFGGPQVIGEINRGLVELLKRDHFRTITEAIGVDNR